MSSTTTSTGTGTGTTAGNHDDEYKSGIGYHHPTTTTVEQLLRECWQYHQEQEIIRCHRHYNQAGDDDVVVVVGIASTDSSHGMMNGNLPSIAPVVPEVPTPTPTPAPNFVMPSIADTTETARLPPTTTNDGHLEPRTHHIASAREQARDIARRFPPAPANVAVPKVTIPEKTDTADHTIYSCTPSNTDINLPVGGGDDDDYIHQRQIGFQREEQRKQKAMIRNFQYLYDQQQHRMAQLNARILQGTSTPTTTTTTTTWTSTSTTTTTTAASSNQNHTTTLLPSMTTTKKRGDSNRRHNDDDDDDCDTDRYHDQQQPQQPQQHDDNTTTTATTTNATTGTVPNTVAIYISIEPTVSTVTSSSTSSNSDQPPPLHLYWNESYLQQLFQTYGTIRNIYLYRHRNKRKSRLGDYKGDGIIVYKLSRNATNDDDDDDQVDDTLRRQQQRQTLIELICGQVCIMF